MELTAQEKLILARFMDSGLALRFHDNWPGLIDWLMEIERGNAEGFLKHFPGQEKALAILQKIIREMPAVAQMVSDSKALGQRSFIASASGSKSAQTANDDRMRQIITGSVRLFASLTE